MPTKKENVHSSTTDIDTLIIEAYNQITLQDAPKVSIETIVETIDRWGQLDNADYWKEALNLDVRNSTPDKNEDFQNACGYVRYFSYHKGKDKLNDIDYEHINQ